MLPSEAAKLIGCTAPHVRFLIRTGRLRARLMRSTTGRYYQISAREVTRFKQLPVTGQGERGKLRGPRSRKPIPYK